MAIGYLAVTSISRAAGRSATAATAYRCAVDVVDERTGEVHGYARRTGVDHVAVIGYAGTPAELANAMELAERRKDAKVARDVVLALPADASPAVRRALAVEWARWVCERHGCAAVVAVHAPGRGGDRRNHHAHVLLTTRRCDGIGLGPKIRDLDQAHTSGEHIEAWRSMWGQMIGVDMRSYERQGIAKRPEPKMPKAAARTAYRAAAEDAALLPDLQAQAGAIQLRIDAEGRRQIPVRPRSRPVAARRGQHPLPMGLQLDQIAYERGIVAPSPTPSPPPAERPDRPPRGRKEFKAWAAENVGRPVTQQAKPAQKAAEASNKTSAIHVTSKAFPPSHDRPRRPVTPPPEDPKRAAETVRAASEPTRPDRSENWDDLGPSGMG